jgi:hypothetical protein
MSARNAQTISRAIALVGLGLLLASCATQPQVRTQAALNVNLTSYRTYAFVAKPGTDKDGYKTLTTQTLERAVSREMLQRGYTPAGAGQEADLLINFNVKEKDKVQGDVGPGGYGWWGGVGYARPWGYGGYGAGWDDYYNGIQTVTEGSLVIDLVDRARNEVVWSGTAVGQLTQKVLDHPDETINKSVTQIFARYPIKAR